MKRYCGLRTDSGPAVWIEDGRVRRDLPHVVRHSPTGFNWGYGGSGPADLALSLLIDALGRRRKAQQLYQAFKWDIVARLPYTEWTLSRVDILAWVRQHESQEVSS
jgi:hypothetical protein